MKLYFVRHATASDIAPRDEERELTREGKEEAHIVGAALAKLGVKPSYILTSPLVRARQTAKIAAGELKFSGAIEVFDELANTISTPSFLKGLRAYASASEIMLVGHMPSLSDHIAAIIAAGSATGLVLGKGSVACVELEQLRAGSGQLRWLMRQKQLSELA